MATKLPPAPPRLPGVGTLFPSMRDPIAYPIQNYRRYGEVVGVHLLNVHGAALYGPAANRYILVDNAENFLVEPLVDRLGVRLLVGEGVLFIDDPRHRKQRRLIMPAFHRKRIENYQEVMRRETQAMLDSWTPGASLDVAAEMRRLALVIAGRTLFSMDLGGNASELGVAVATLVGTLGSVFNATLARVPFNLPLLGGRGGSVRAGLARIDLVLGAIIAEHEREGTDTGDVVSMLVAARDDDGSRLSPKQIRDHLLTLFVAGHETSANALAWTFYLLAQHPEVTARLLSELDGALHGAAPTAADLERLPYLEQVIKESMRLYPPAPSAVRTAREGFEWQGYTIRAGEVVFYSPYISHRMPHIFPEPETFRPERFAPDSPENPPPYAYIPFAAGPRSCIGAPFAMMEIKTVLAMTLPRFRMDLVRGQRVDQAMRLTLQPKYGIQMRPQPQDGHPERSRARVLGNVVGATPGPP
jgi:cytochrome P450